MYNKPEKELELLEKQKAQISALIESEKALLLSMMQHMLKVWQRILKQRERQKMVCSPLKLVVKESVVELGREQGFKEVMFYLSQQEIDREEKIAGNYKEINRRKAIQNHFYFVRLIVVTLIRGERAGGRGERALPSGVAGHGGEILGEVRAVLVQQAAVA